MKNNKESQRLEKIAEDSWYNKGANYVTIKYSFKIFNKYFNKGSLLEIGPAEGVMTGELISSFDDYTIVEGSKIFCEKLKEMFPGVQIFNSLFENFQTTKKFNNIILGHVLEHVEDPIKILIAARDCLADNGIILAAVPNANSIHRQAAVKMGILKSVFELNSTDIHHGHRRVYDLEKFKNDFSIAGLKIIKQGGYWLKPLSNKQIEEHWDTKMLMTFMALGENYPDIAAEIYIIASK